MSLGNTKGYAPHRPLGALEGREGRGRGVYRPITHIGKKFVVRYCFPGGDFYNER